MMRRRVVALAISVVVVGTPEAFAICQLICVSSSVHGHIASHEHSGTASQHSARPVSDVAINIQAIHHNGCHRNQVTPLTAPTPERTISAAIVTTVTILPPQPPISIFADGAGANRSPSVPIHTPLRI